jgi:PAS domain S-box-containing protein
MAAAPASQPMQSLPSTDDLQRLVDTAPALLHSAQPDGSLDFCNQGWLDFLGARMQELQGWGWADWAYPDDLPPFADKWRACLSTGDCFEAESRVRRADGQYRWVWMRNVPLRDDTGRIVRWYGAGIDIEDRKSAEEKVRRSELDLRMLFDSMPAHVGFMEADGRRLFANRRALDFLGLTLDEWVKSTPGDYTHPSDVERVVALLQQGLADRVEHELEVRLRVKSGEYRWVLIRVSPLFDEQGQVARWCVARTDIDKQKRAEEALRRSEGYLAEGQLLTHTGSWAYNPSGVFDFWSNETYRIFGFDPTKPVTLDGYLTHVHPEHRAETAAILQRMVAEGCDCDHKYRVVLPGGELRFVRCVGRAVRENGVVSQLVGTAMDITEQEQMTLELRRSEALLTEAQKLSHTGSFCWNATRDEIFWSDETFRIYEYDRTKIKPTLETVMERVHPEDRKFVQDMIAFILNDGKGWDLEHRLMMPDGRIKHLHTVGTPVVNQAGEVEFVGSVADVTDAQRALREIEDLKDRLYKENIALKEEVDQASMFEEIVGSSEPLRRVLTHVAKVAPTDSTVLITGETGTGKELVARAIHKRSPRSGRAFIRVNCGAIPQSLISSELFGHEKGAFTGATQRRPGRFELADGGTLFLDEVGELPPETQVALLRVLQEREFERVGGCEPVTVDVRVLAATNRKLQDAVSDKTFREDLYYRLNVFPIHMPSLRERADDIPLLVQYLVGRYAIKVGKRIERIEKRTLELLQSYHWPGNVRELQNVIERAVILCDGEVLSVDELCREQPVPPPQSGLLTTSLHDQERQLIESALSECRGRVSGASGAAAKLGIPRSTLESRIRSLQIDKHRFRSP